MGTAGYMAPEQIRGQQVDGRADLFALGVVLYEMVAGHRAFARESAVESLNAILKEDPPELTTRPDLPPALDRIVRHCLEKNPAERFQSARDVIFALETLMGSSASGSALPAIVPPARSRVASARLGWAVAALATAALVAAIVAPRTPAPSSRRRRGSSRSAHPISGSSHTRRRQSRLMARRWHSGRRTRMDASSCGFEIWAASRRARCRIRGSPNSRQQVFQPAFSPDGRTLVVFMDTKLKRVSLDGGSPQTLADAPNPRGATLGRR